MYRYALVAQGGAASSACPSRGDSPKLAIGELPDHHRKVLAVLAYIRG
jgi:hypothetical protein